MLELRILNGLHRGAMLPLDERALALGASDDADVVLVDPGIAACHALLAPQDGAWTLTAQDGVVLGAQDNRSLAALVLRAGDFARLDRVWIMLAESGAAWENPPPDPVGEVTTEPPAETGDPAPEPFESFIDDAADETVAEAVAEAAPAPPPTPTPGPAPTPAPPAARRRWRRAHPLILGLAFATVLSACAAYTMSSREAPPPAAPKPAAARPAARKLEDLPAPAPADETRLSPEALREAFRKRLKEVDLLKRFQLDLRDRAWEMRAALDEDEAARFDRILTSFVQAHGIKFPVHATIGGAEAMLPFRIREVVTGANAGVVTADGKRLYVGDEYRGVRLAAVESDVLRFEGERKIKVKW